MSKIYKEMYGYPDEPLTSVSVIKRFEILLSVCDLRETGSGTKLMLRTKPQGPFAMRMRLFNLFASFALL